jgi:hypothetical protein
MQVLITQLERTLLAQTVDAEHLLGDSNGGYITHHTEMGGESET